MYQALFLLQSIERARGQGPKVRVSDSHIRTLHEIQSMADHYNTHCNTRIGHYHYRFVLWLSRDKLAIIKHKPVYT